MANILEVNSKAYAKRYQRELVAHGGKTSLRFETEKAPDGDETLYITDGNGVFRMNSAYSPAHEAERWAEAYAFEDICQDVCVFGFGSGHFIRALLNKGGEDAAFFVYEPSGALFSFVCEKYDVSDILQDPRVHLILAEEGDVTFNRVLHNEMRGSGFSRMQVIALPQYEELFAGEIDDYKENVRQALETKYINHNTIIQNSRAALYNNFYCMNHLHETSHLGMVRDRYSWEDVPFILVSTGPSLDKNVEELKRAKGRAVIVSYNYSTKVLLDHGIEPDILVHLDAEGEAFSFIDERLYHLPIIGRAGADIRVQDVFAGHFIMTGFEMPYSFIPGLEHVETLESIGGSVALMSFSVALSLGVKNIILVGQDLAMGDADRGYAGNRIVAWGKEDGIEEVDGYYGGKVRTRADLNMFRRTFELAIDAHRDEVRVINATEGGAMIHGAINMPLAEAIDRFCKKGVDARRYFYDLPKVQTREEHERTVRAIREYLTRWEGYCEDFERIVGILRRLRSGLADGSLGVDETQRLLERYKAIDNRWRADETGPLVDTLIRISAVKHSEEVGHTGGEGAMERVYDAAIETYVDARKELGQWITDVREMFGE